MTNTTSDSHPCFGATGRASTGRIHLPVACLRNSRLRYGVRESKGIIMSPVQALAHLQEVVATGKNVGMVGICGLGEPFANADATMKTLALVREAYPEMPLCVTTNGMHVAPYAKELAKLGISHITFEMHAVNTAIAEQIYAWIRPAKKTIPLTEGVAYLIKEQVEGIMACKEAGLTVKVNTTLFGNINADHIEAIACTMSGLGVDIMSVAPCPASEENVAGTVAHDITAEADADGSMVPTAEALQAAREAVARHMPLMVGWDQCGYEPLGQSEVIVNTSCDANSDTALVGAKEKGPFIPKPTASRPNVAVASAGGMEVDTHLGHAQKFLIYGPREDGLACLLEAREAPEAGGGDSRWQNLSATLSDCFAVLVSGVGQKPRQVLGENGIYVFTGDWEISGIVDVLYGGGKKNKK